MIDIVKIFQFVSDWAYHSESETWETEMSKIKSIPAAILLTLVLAVPALAGNIGSPGSIQPPPLPPLPASENIGSPGSPLPWNIDIPGTSSPGLVDLLIAVLSLV